MTLESIYFVAEIAAAITVIASLLYVAVQIRQNTLTVRIAAGQAHVDAYDSLLQRITDDGGLATAWVASATDPTVLDDAERTRVFGFAGVMFRNFEGAYIQWEAGVLDDRFWQGIKRSMTDQYAHGVVRVFWSVRRHWFSDEFGDWFDKEVVAKSDGV